MIPGKSCHTPFQMSAVIPHSLSRKLLTTGDHRCRGSTVVSRFLRRFRDVSAKLLEVNICCKAKRTSPTFRKFAVFGQRRNVHQHSSMLLIGSDWLVWTSATLTSRRGASEPTDIAHAVCFLFFISPCRFDHLMSGVNVELIY